MSEFQSQLPWFLNGRLSTHLIAALVGLFSMSGCAQRGDGLEPTGDSATVPIQVRTLAVQPRQIERTVEGIGHWEALPNASASLTPALEGHVHRIVATLGQRLRAGDAIVELDATVAAADLGEKTANRDALRASLELLKATPRPVDRKPLELAIEQAKIAHARAKANLERLRPLRSRNEVSDAQVFDAEQALAQAEIQQQVAEAQLQSLMAGPRSEAVAEAEAKLAGAEDAVALSRAHLELHTIHSPIDGVLDSLHCRLGETIAPGTPIGEVVDTGRLLAVVWLPPQSARHIHAGQSAKIFAGEVTLNGTTPGARIGGTSSAEGTVESIGQVVDSQTGELPVRISFDNHDNRFVVGQTLTASIIVDIQHQALAVPLKAIMDLGEGPEIAVVREGKLQILRPTAIEAADHQAVVEGTDLKSGELVVVDGGFNLPEGTAVKVISDALPADPTHE